MNFADLLLDLAEFAQGTEEHTVDSYDPATLTMMVSNFSGKVGEYGGGTLWFYDDAGVCGVREITRAAGSTIVIDSAFPDGLTVSDILITPAKDFDIHTLSTAINSVLSQYEIMAYDESLALLLDEISYNLPDSVTNDIRRVEIWRDLYSVSVWDVCHFWKLADRKLEIYSNPYRYLEGAKLRISYVKNHGRVSINADINPSIRRDYVRCMAYMNLYRSQIQKRHKDNPIAVDLFNEAKNYEQQFTNRHIPKCDLLKKDMCYPYYE